jgi:hypothetical protein
MYLMASVLSHNLLRTLQMQPLRRRTGRNEKRSPLIVFEEAQTIRSRLLHRAGRLTRPNGKLRLTMSGNERTRETVLRYLDALKSAA